MSSGQAKWVRWLKGLLAFVILGLILSAWRHYSAEVRSHVSTIDLGQLTIGVALCISYRILNSSGWVLVLRAMGQQMPLLRGMRLWLLAESMRWLPGSIWGFCSRVYQATKCGISPAIASASLPLELFLTIAAWGIVAAAGIIGSGRSVDWSGLISTRVLLLAGAGVAAVGLLVALCLLKLPHGRLASKLKSLQAEIVNLRTIQLSPVRLALVLVLYTTLCCLNGIAFYFVLRSVSSVAVSLPAVIGINACGWLLGFLAVGAPGGIGVREAGSAFLLSALMPMPAAIAGSVLWRLVMILDEVTCLTVCLAPGAVNSWLGNRPPLKQTT